MKFRHPVILLLLIALTGICIIANAQQPVVTEKVLNAKQQSLIIIASYTAQGDLDNLQPAFEAGLDNGLTINQIKEAIVHLYAYCGFPRSIRGLQTLMKVLDEPRTNGIQDEPGLDASLITDHSNKYQRGVEILYELTGRDWNTPKSGYGAFAPVIDKFLKEHLFADIFERNVLTYQQRELLTIAALSSIGGVTPMLKGHLNICLHVGLTANQLRQFVDIMRSTIGKKQAKSTQRILDELLNAKEE